MKPGSWGGGRGFCDNRTTALVVKKRDNVGMEAKNRLKLSDAPYGRPLICYLVASSRYQKLVIVWLK